MAAAIQETWLKDRVEKVAQHSSSESAQAQKTILSTRSPEFNASQCSGNKGKQQGVKQGSQAKASSRVLHTALKEHCTLSCPISSEMFSGRNGHLDSPT